MPSNKVIQRARKDEREGKSPSTQAGEFVKEEFRHIREGKHGAKNTKQAIAIGLSEARRAGVKIPAKGKAAGRRRKPSGEGLRRESVAKRARVSRGVLKREPRAAASKRAISKQARSAARKRGPVARRRAALKAARTRKSRQAR